MGIMTDLVNISYILMGLGAIVFIIGIVTLFIKKVPIALKAIILVLGVLVAAGGLALFLNERNKDTQEITPSPTPTVEAVEPTVAPDGTVDPTMEPDIGIEPTTAPEANGEPGTIDGTTFTSESMGFSISMPDNWTIMNYEDSYNTLYSVMGTLYENVDTMKSAMKAAGIDYPFYAIMNDRITDTPNVICQSAPSSAYGANSLENIMAASVEQTIQQYLSMNGISEAEPVEKFDVNGNEIYSATITTVINGEFAGQMKENYKIIQRLVFFKTKDTVINLSITYYDEIPVEDIDSIIASIKFQ